MSAILRPAGVVLDELSLLAKQAGEVVGPGHWVHGADALHFTLRALSRYQDVVRPDDYRHYGAALDAAGRTAEPFQVEMYGVVAHAGGILALGHPVGAGLGTLQRNLGRELAALGADGFEDWVRDLWYVSLVHFAAPVPNPAHVLDWCDSMSQGSFGVTEIDAAEVARFRLVDGSMRAECLHLTSLA